MLGTDESRLGERFCVLENPIEDYLSIQYPADANKEPPRTFLAVYHRVDGFLFLETEYFVELAFLLIC